MVVGKHLLLNGVKKQSLLRFVNKISFFPLLHIILINNVRYNARITAL